MDEQPASPRRLFCATCREELRPAKVTASYLGNRFPIELPTCPSCGLVFVPEDLAIGKMLRVEQKLEDK